MSGPQNPGRHADAELSVCGCDQRFLRSLSEFTEQEKRNGTGTEPDRFRHSIYRSVFSQVISRATAYQRLLLSIKAEYDDIIRELQRRVDETGSGQRTLAASTSHTDSVMTCQRRATQLRRRTSDIQRETAELQEELQRRTESRKQSSGVPGLTGVQSEDPEALDRHLRHLETQRAILLDQKSRRVSLEVKARLDTELQNAEHHRDHLRLQNRQLMVLCHRLGIVSEHLSSLKNHQRPPEELLSSTLQSIRRAEMTEDDACRIDAELFEDEEPTGVDQSKLLSDYLDRFSELLESAQYDEAALLAAKSPGGVLRNVDTLEVFKGVEGPPGCVPPLLLFLQALLVTVPPGDKLPAAVSQQVVLYALQHGAMQLVTHAIMNNKLTPSEDLGDLLTEHAHKNRGVADACLTLSTIVYEGCRLDRKTALSMCRRGLIHGAAEWMKHANGLTAEDHMWVLARSSSLSLFQRLTEPLGGQSAILSVGVACLTLLADPQHQDFGLEILDSFVSRGEGALEAVILEDSSSSLEVWTQLASLCSNLNRSDLSQAIISVLLDQTGTRVLSPDLEGARLMEHIFL